MSAGDEPLEAVVVGDQQPVVVAVGVVSAGVVAVVARLVHGQHGTRRVDDAHVVRDRRGDEKVVVPGPADDQIGNGMPREGARHDEVILGVRYEEVRVLRAHQLLQVVVPVDGRQRLVVDVHVGSAPDHQLVRQRRQFRLEVPQRRQHPVVEEDVAVRVAVVVAGVVERAQVREHVLEERRAEAVGARHAVDVPAEADGEAYERRAEVGGEQDGLDERQHEGPVAQRVSVDVRARRRLFERRAQDDRRRRPRGRRRAPRSTSRTELVQEEEEEADGGAERVRTALRLPRVEQA